MKKIPALILFFGGFITSSIFGQTTSVTATITDSDSQTWNNGTWQAVLTNSNFPNGPFLLDGVQLTASQLQQNGSMSSSGVITGTFYDVVNHIVPNGSFYLFTLCPQASAPCVSNIGASPTGGSINLSTTLSANLKGPRFPAVGANAFGYLDIEVAPTPLPGGQYYNVTSGFVKLWNGSAWQQASGAFVPLAGGTMTGTLTLGATAASAIRWQSPTTSTNTTFGGAPFTGASGIVNYAGTNDNTYGWGYNYGSGSGGLVPVPGQVQMFHQDEVDYYDGTNHIVESHLDLIYPNGHIYRPMYWGQAMGSETSGLWQFNVGTTGNSALGSGFVIASGQFGAATKTMWALDQQPYGASTANSFFLVDPTATYTAATSLLATGQLQIGQSGPYGTRPTDVYISTDTQGTLAAPAVDITQSAVVLPLGAMTLGINGNPGVITVGTNVGTGGPGNINFGSGFGTPAIYIYNASGSNNYGLGTPNSANMEFFAASSGVGGFSWNSGFQSTVTTAQLMALSGSGVLTIAGVFKAAGSTFTAAAPTVAASQIGFGGTTAVVANCGVTGPTACIVVNIAGTTHYIPYY